jgi:hypothetical protein
VVRGMGVWCWSSIARTHMHMQAHACRIRENRCVHTPGGRGGVDEARVREAVDGQGPNPALRSVAWARKHTQAMRIRLKCMHTHHDTHTYAMQPDDR